MSNKDQFKSILKDYENELPKECLQSLYDWYTSSTEKYPIIIDYDYFSDRGWHYISIFVDHQHTEFSISLNTITGKFQKMSEGRIESSVVNSFIVVDNYTGDILLDWSLEEEEGYEPYTRDMFYSRGWYEGFIAAKEMADRAKSLKDYSKRAIMNMSEIVRYPEDLTRGYGEDTLLIKKKGWFKNKD